METFKINLTLKEEYCGTQEFEVNGIVADADDFIEKEDKNPEYAQDYGCGNMVASVIKSTEEVLNKYSINETEYIEVAEGLAEGLSFGCCNGCY